MFSNHSNRQYKDNSRETKIAMREIIIKRNNESLNLLDYKVIFENGQSIVIRNGETKKVTLDKFPIKAYARQGWLKSKDVTIDSSTTELTLKGEKTKNLIGPGIGGLLVLTLLLPKKVFDNSNVAETISIIGLSILLLWIIYAFIIKSNDWILIEKKTSA